MNQFIENSTELWSRVLMCVELKFNIFLKVNSTKSDCKYDVMTNKVLIILI